MEVQKNILIDDFNMNYYENGEGKVIVFLHGNGMNSTQFKKMYNKFKENHKVIALDIRGSGKSSTGKENINMKRIINDIIEFLEKKFIKKVILIGYSDGANIAMMIAKEYPQYVDKMILICGNYNIDGICLWFKILLKFYSCLLKLMGIFSTKSRIRLELLNLIFEDMNLTDKDLMNFTMETLILYSSIDVIYKKHSLKISELIKKSKIILIKKSTHESIIRNNFAINQICKFI
ncbi:MAG: alpha/beta fold hydrolase [Sarcina sp.]